MGNLEKREKVLLIIMAIVCAIFIYYKFYFNPLLLKIDGSRENIIKYEEDIENIGTEKAIKNKLKKNINKLSKQYDESTKYFPHFEKNPEIAYDLRFMADENEISLVRLMMNSPNSEVEQKSKDNKDMTLYSVDTNLSVLGTYRNIINYISNIEKGDRICQVQSVLLAGDNGENSDVLRSDITVKYYYSSSTEQDELNYNFNTGNYGKSEIFSK